MTEKTSLIFLLLCSVIIPVSSLDFPTKFEDLEYAKIVENGRTDIPLTGINGFVLSARRNNLNAHSFNLITFYIQNNAGLDAIEIMDSDSKSSFSMRTEDFDGEQIVSTCIVIKPSTENSLYLIRIARTITNSFSEPSSTLASVYKLEYSEVEGRYIFRSFKTIVCKNKYRSATDAITEIVRNFT